MISESGESECVSLSRAARSAFVCGAERIDRGRLAAFRGAEAFEFDERASVHAESSGGSSARMIVTFSGRAASKASCASVAHTLLGSGGGRSQGNDRPLGVSEQVAPRCCVKSCAVLNVSVRVWVLRRESRRGETPDREFCAGIFAKQTRVGSRRYVAELAEVIATGA
jgi:hypothetical protein